MSNRMPLIEAICVARKLLYGENVSADERHEAYQVLADFQKHANFMEKIAGWKDGEA